MLGLVASYLGIYFYLRVIQLMFMSAEAAVPVNRTTSRWGLEAATWQPRRFRR